MTGGIEIFAKQPKDICINNLYRYLPISSGGADNRAVL